MRRTIQSTNIHLEQLVFNSESHPLVDEAQAAEIVQQALGSLQAFLNLPSFQSLLGPTKEQLASLEHACGTLRGDDARLRAAEVPSADEIRISQDALIGNLRARVLQYQMQVDLLNSQRKNDALMEKTREELTAVGEKAARAGDAWHAQALCVRDTEVCAQNGLRLSTAAARAEAEKAATDVATARFTLDTSTSKVTALEEELVSVLGRLEDASRSRHRAAVRLKVLTDGSARTAALRASEAASLTRVMDEARRLRKECEGRHATLQPVRSYIHTTCGAIQKG